jgi:hypothetical protein
LEAYQQSVEEGTDAHSQALKDRMELNAIAAATIANDIQDKMAWLTNEKNPKNMSILGAKAMDSLIAGLESKEDLAVATAQRIAAKIRAALAGALGDTSPLDTSASRVTGTARSVAATMGEDLGTSGDTLVKVFIGDEELTGIVRTEVTRVDAESSLYVTTGRRI